MSTLTLPAAPPVTAPSAVSEDQIVKAYQWALSYASQQADRLTGSELADRLHDAATDAVMLARAKFDPARGASFTTFCRHVVIPAVRRAMSQDAARAAKRPKVASIADDFDAEAKPSAAPVDDGPCPEFEGLPDDLRRAAELYHLHGHTQAECGRLLGVDQATVSRMLRDAAGHLAARA